MTDDLLLSWLLLLLLGLARGDTGSSRASMAPTFVNPFSVIYANSLAAMGFRCSMIKESREAKRSLLLSLTRLDVIMPKSADVLGTVVLSLYV
ncbi:unnamed protein product [Microthlaspi erraticum]|uniref:Uncharacterized protein n=1 Tax=Microthlaspi erraticum TaxID=1685480 RepID=A0A6D2HW49_9BRAS|nr:unnamed protein product [Microthlaspi erraticum]